MSIPGERVFDTSPTRQSSMADRTYETALGPPEAATRVDILSARVVAGSLADAHFQVIRNGDAD
jgi:hypothetical protein